MIAVTVDAVILARRKPGDYSVLMVRRRNEPFQGQLALPGGFLDEGEGLMEGALRELHEETGLKLNALGQHGAYGAPDRDPRGHTISIVFRTLLKKEYPVDGRDDATEAVWLSLADVARNKDEIAFDHREIILQIFRDDRTWKEGIIALVEQYAHGV